MVAIQDPAQFISAKVENIVSYGAFFGLDDGCSGFVHISQVRNSPNLVLLCLWYLVKWSHEHPSWNSPESPMHGREN